MSARNKDYRKDLHHDLQSDEFALEYLAASAKEGPDTLRIASRDLLAARAIKAHGSDVCFCGDYRSQHTTNGCQPCKLNPPLLEKCKVFSLSHKASIEEREHWEKYHGAAPGERRRSL